MTPKTLVKRAPTTPAAVVCTHRLQHETDWLGWTYFGCPVCHQWKAVKPRAAVADARRWAA